MLRDGEFSRRHTREREKAVSTSTRRFCFPWISFMYDDDGFVFLIFHFFSGFHDWVCIRGKLWVVYYFFVLRVSLVAS